MSMQTIKIQPLTAESFLPYGEVIACEGNDFSILMISRPSVIMLWRLLKQMLKVGLSIFRNIQTTAIPFAIEMLERHPVGSQAFIPMQGQKFLIVVAPNLDHEKPDLSQIQAFISNGTQSVNYRAGTWHHPLLTFEAPSDFVVIDRIGTGPNCDVYTFPEKIFIEN